MKIFKKVVIVLLSMTDFIVLYYTGRWSWLMIVKQGYYKYDDTRALALVLPVFIFALILLILLVYKLFKKARRDS